MANPVAIVVGGGIAGPAAAVFLKRAGFRPVVYEAYAQSSDIGGALQIAPNGMQVLRELGVSEVLLQKGVESAEFCFENQAGKKLGCVPNGPAALYGTPAVQVSRFVLHQALLDELEREEIPIHYSSRLEQIVFGERDVTARFAGGATATGEVLVGADGIHSQARRAMFPEGPSPAYTGLITVGGFARHEELRAKDVRDQRRTHMIFGMNGFFGYGYYDRNDPSAVMWWSHIERKDALLESERQAMSTDELRKQMLERLKGWAAPVESIVLHTERLLWGPVDDLPSLHDWSKDRAVLIGDAAHAISPHAGQGASLALEDALCLAKHLRDRPYAEAFRLYRTERWERVEKIVTEARKRGEGKHDLPPPAARVRDFILSLFLRVRGKHMFDEAYGYKMQWE